METTIYIDTLFVLNLIVNYLLLLASARISGALIKRPRMALSAALGGLYAVAVFMPGLSFLASPAVKLAFAPLMTLIAFPLPDWRVFIKLTLVFLSVSCVFAGGIMAIWLLFGAGNPYYLPYIPIDVKTLLLSAGICYLLISCVFRKLARGRKRGGEIVPVSITYEGRQSLMRALVDTGNTLSDPMTGAPVMVAELDSIKPLLARGLSDMVSRESLSNPIGLLETLADAGHGQRFRLIPYKSVGVNSGVMLAFRPEQTYIDGINTDGLLVAISPTRLSDGSDYTALVR